MRLLVAEPATDGGRYPGLVFFSDIFALTPATVRAVVRFAGHGFVVVAPEFYHRTLAPGTAIPFEDRDGAFGAAGAMQTAMFDADSRTALDYLATHERVRAGALGVTGFCIGGHLAVRAALQPDVKAAVAFYPTGLHDGTLGGSTGVDTLERVERGEIPGRITLAFGAADPHIPLAAITAIQTAFARSGSAYYLAMYDGEHAFMRDEGPRYDPAETDRAYANAVDFFDAALTALG